MTQRSNFEWLTALRGGKDEDAALAELRMRLRAALIGHLNKHSLAQGQLSPDECLHLAEDCAQEAVLAIRAKLDGFRGESQFMTWAYSIAVRLALGELRRRRWRRSLLEKAQLGQALPTWPIEQPGPERSLQQKEAWALLTRLIESELTPRQRSAVIAHAFQEMPLDLVAEWLGSNRNSVYKLIHDARQRLKRALLAQGVTHRDLLGIFVESPSGSPLPAEGKNFHIHRIQ